MVGDGALNTDVDANQRLLNLAERDMLAQTQPAMLAGLSAEDLQSLGKRLRSARDRYRRISARQQREMRGKSDPHGATPARDNTGSVGKVEVLVEALKRVTLALRKLRAPSQAELARKALAAKQAAPVSRHPSGGRSASTGMISKPTSRDSVKVDPREVGRVSKGDEGCAGPARQVGARQVGRRA